MKHTDFKTKGFSSVKRAGLLIHTVNILITVRMTKWGFMIATWKWLHKKAIAKCCIFFQLYIYKSTASHIYHVSLRYLLHTIIVRVILLAKYCPNFSLRSEVALTNNTLLYVKFSPHTHIGQAVCVLLHETRIKQHCYISSATLRFLIVSVCHYFHACQTSCDCLRGVIITKIIPGQVFIFVMYKEDNYPEKE